MAKKKTQTLEEALVPKSEQPYAVSENWVWVLMENAAKWGSGGTPSRKNQSYYGGNILWVKTGELDNNIIFDTEEKITELALSNSSAKLFPVNTVLVAMYGATIGKVAILGCEASTNQACACAVANNATDYQYLFYYLLSQKDAFIKKGKGGAQPNISQEIIKAHEIPLPPIAEQRRIVARIESLFEKLDHARELVQSALDSFETRKAAILHKAFTGELTVSGSVADADKALYELKRQREYLIKEKKIQRAKVTSFNAGEQSEYMPQHWRFSKLGEVAFVTKLAGFEYTKYFDLHSTGEVPVIRAQNVRMGYLDLTNLQYISNAISNELPRSSLTKASLLITFIGAGIGDICIFEENRRYHLAPNVAKVEIFNEEDLEHLHLRFLLYYLLSGFGQSQIFKHLKATAQPSLSMETIRDIIIPIPSPSEQAEIVRILDSLLDKEQKAKEQLEPVLDQIDLMKKSILARAFRGELGTNDPSEASALGLLEEILK